MNASALARSALGGAVTSHALGITLQAPDTLHSLLGAFGDYQIRE